MKKLIVFILMVFSVVCYGGVMPVANPPIIAEPENCAQFEKELDFKKPYMRFDSCQRLGDVGNPLSITYYVLGKYGKRMEQDLMEKFHIAPLTNHRQIDVWSSDNVLENYYHDERILVILVGMTDWGAKTREEWDSPNMQFLIKFTKYPYLW